VVDPTDDAPLLDDLFDPDAPSEADDGTLMDVFLPNNKE